MTVRTAPIYSDAAGIEEQIEIVITQNIHTRIRKRFRTRQLMLRQRLVITHTLRAQNPKDFLRQTQTLNLKMGLLKNCRAERQKVRVIIGASSHDRQNLSAVRVSY